MTRLVWNPTLGVNSGNLDVPTSIVDGCQWPVRMLEEFALERGYPLYALNVAFNMYSGNRCILVQRTVSEWVQATCGLLSGCGYAVDMLHAFHIRSLRCAGRHVQVRNLAHRWVAAGANNLVCVAQPCPVPMNRTRALGLPAHIKAWR
eukprot:6483660-Amphidinium_carterae.3